MSSLRQSGTDWSSVYTIYINILYLNDFVTNVLSCPGLPFKACSQQHSQTAALSIRAQSSELKLWQLSNTTGCCIYLAVQALPYVNVLSNTFSALLSVLHSILMHRTLAVRASSSLFSSVCIYLLLCFVYHTLRQLAMRTGLAIMLHVYVWSAGWKLPGPWLFLVVNFKKLNHNFELLIDHQSISPSINQSFKVIFYNFKPVWSAQLLRLKLYICRCIIHKSISQSINQSSS